MARDSDTAFKVKGQLAGGGGILWRAPAQLVISYNVSNTVYMCKEVLQYRRRSRNDGAPDHASCYRVFPVQRRLSADQPLICTHVLLDML